MDWQIECAAVIPCLNEARSIGSLVAAVRRHVDHVIVVDDGSEDATGPLAREAGAQVVRHVKPLGKGAALQAGWRSAHEHGFLWVLMLDGDGQHSPDNIPVLFKCAEATGAALVVGNRMRAAAEMPWVRRQVNRWMSWRISRQLGRTLPDTQCGFRLMHLGAWAAVPLATSHFEIESEMLFRFVRAGQTVEFVPIQVIYKNERSKIHPVRDTLRWFRWWRLAKNTAHSSIPPTRRERLPFPFHARETQT
jgi:glycosyltransferase involved in cell wall biosynthesis